MISSKNILKIFLTVVRCSQRSSDLPSYWVTFYTRSGFIAPGREIYSRVSVFFYLEDRTTLFKHALELCKTLYFKPFCHTHTRGETLVNGNKIIH